MTTVAAIISFILCPPQYRRILESFIVSSTLHNKVTEANKDAAYTGGENRFLGDPPISELQHRRFGPIVPVPFRPRAVPAVALKDVYIDFRFAHRESPRTHDLSQVQRAARPETRTGRPEIPATPRVSRARLAARENHADPYALPQGPP